jgi:hypothetical protein
MHRFLIVIEKAGKNYSACFPGLARIVTGRTCEGTAITMTSATGSILDTTLRPE